jgi:hypothetical protein
MLKNILNLEGAQKLTKNEQKSINGGAPVYCQRSQCDTNQACSSGAYCEQKICMGEYYGTCVGGQGTAN